MKKLLLATTGLVALVGMAAPASAADMAVKARPPAPVIAPIYDWTGFYIGANGGWGQSRNCWDFVDVAGLSVASGCRDRSQERDLAAGFLDRFDSRSRGAGDGQVQLRLQLEEKTARPRSGTTRLMSSRISV